MADITSDDVLFVGKGDSVICWYRVALPADHLGCPWVGVYELDGELRNFSGLETNPQLDSYKVVVIQQPDSPGWINRIAKAKDAGVIVLIEVDDYVDGVRHQPDHPARDKFPKERIGRLHQAMRMSDGVICSTPWLAKTYSKYNRTWVCQNSLDLRRYIYTRPQREVINFGWAGGVAHKEVMQEWMVAIDALMGEYQHVGFVSIGDKFKWLSRKHPSRTMALPFGRIENYPAVMQIFDIALAPAGTSTFFRGKSDLRFLEAAAGRLPVIGHPLVYPTIKHGETGFHATEAAEVYAYGKALIENSYARRDIGLAARAYVERERTIEKGVDQWVAVFEEVIG